MKLVQFTIAAPDRRTIFISPLQVMAVEAMRGSTAIFTTVSSEKGRPFQYNVKEPVNDVVALLSDASE